MSINENGDNGDVNADPPVVPMPVPDPVEDHDHDLTTPEGQAKKEKGPLDAVVKVVLVLAIIYGIGICRNQTFNIKKIYLGYKNLIEHVLKNFGIGSTLPENRLPASNPQEGKEQAVNSEKKAAKTACFKITSNNWKEMNNYATNLTAQKIKDRKQKTAPRQFYAYS